MERGAVRGSVEPVVRMEAMWKRYGSATALRDARLEVRAGEVHAVLGENGAGKTTLLSILGGLVRPDAGRITVGGDLVDLRTPRDAWRMGIGLVHQHFTLVPRFSVLENLALGGRGRRGGLGLPLADLRRRIRELERITGLDVKPDAIVEELGVGRQQRVEILKVLLREPRVLVLDEPTAVLSPSEVDGLLSLLKRLAREGGAVVLVAHKLDEVLRVADRVTVLRRGRTVLEAPRSEVDGSRLTRAMVGRSVEEASRVGARTPHREDEPVARLEGVSLEPRERGSTGLKEVHLDVFRGEIVGIAGVEGNGQRELARVLAGIRSPDRGVARLPTDPGYVPQDRRREGLVADFDLTENLTLALHREARFRVGPFLRWGPLRREAGEGAARFGVQPADPRLPARSLSGGNQQRAVLARELGRRPVLLVAEDPTRGLDVAAEAFVHGELLELRELDPPPGVVLISTDLDEVLALADRIFVMVRGALRPVPEGERSREGIGALMLAGEAGPPVAGAS